MPGNFAEFGPEALGPRLAEQDYAKSISGSIGDLMHLAQTQEADARLPLIRAEARKTGAEADKLERDVGLQKRYAELLSGRAPTGGSGNMGYDLAEIAGAVGDVDKATKYQLQGTQIEANQALTASRKTAQEVSQLDSIRRYANLTSQMALGVVDQSSYDRFLRDAGSLGLNVEGLPSDYASGKGQLDQLVAQGMTAKQRADVEIATRLRDQQETVNAATVRARNASINANNARADLIKQRLSDIRKNGGEKSPQAAEYRQELTKLAKARREAIDIKMPSPIPSTPAQREAGKVYLWTDGKTKVVWDKNPATGKMQARELSPAEESKMSKVGGAVMGALKSLTSSSDEDVLGGEDDDE